MNETLGQRIKRYRLAAGLSQAKLATACGWKSQSRVGNYEMDSREPTLADLALLAEALGITQSELMLNPDSQAMHAREATGAYESGASRRLPSSLNQYEKDLLQAFRAADKGQRLKVLLYLNGEAESLAPARPFGLDKPSQYADMDIFEDLDAQVEEHSSNIHSLADQLRAQVSGKSAEAIRDLTDRMEAEALAVRDAYLQRFSADQVQRKKQ